jgi:formate C-acetyltransferase
MSSLARFRTDAPNVALRVHRDTPRPLLKKACELLAAGRTMPALVNDEPVLAGMRRRGIKPQHARDYTLVGCSQVVSRGRSGGTFEDVICCTTKALELALHDGIDPVTSKRMGPATGEPSEMDTYGKLEAALLAQLSFLVAMTTGAANRQYAIVSEHYPDLLKSLLIEGCLERGRDYRRGGPLYTEGLANLLGVTNLGDSMLVLRRLVYEERQLSLSEFVEILDRDWEGQEMLRQQCIHAVAKFGNDDPEADAVTVGLVEQINKMFQSRGRVFGGSFGVDIVPWSGAVDWGRRSEASPDGRRRGDALADSAGASQGMDRAGVTAALRSVAKLPHDQAHGLLVLNLRFSTRVFAGQEGVDKMMVLVDSALGLGIQQMQINVVNAQTLRAAQVHPEEFESLVVRVGGFSTFFNWLSLAHQNDIIARTEHEI